MTSEIIRLFGWPYKANNPIDKRIAINLINYYANSVNMLDKKRNWFSRRGWTTEQIIDILNQARSRSERLTFPDFWGKMARLNMAAQDLGNNGIPVSDATRLLGISNEGINFAPQAERPPLPFGHHPMLSQYPFVRQAIAHLPEVRELYHQRNRGDTVLGQGSSV